MNFSKRAVVGVAMSLMLAGSALAAEEQAQAEVRHGGVTTMLKNRDYELVAKPGILTVYVYQDEKPASTKGATGSIILSRGEDKTTTTLEPTGTNALEAKGSFKIGAGTHALGTITLAGRKPQEVTWTLK
jgi:hypothetical protein